MSNGNQQQQNQQQGKKNKGGGAPQQTGMSVNVPVSNPTVLDGLKTAAIWGGTLFIGSVVSAFLFKPVSALIDTARRVGGGKPEESIGAPATPAVDPGMQKRIDGMQKSIQYKDGKIKELEAELSKLNPASSDTSKDS